MSSRNHQLSIDGVTVKYGDHLALNNIRIDSECGRSIGVIGPNGAGKSTLMKAIASLVPMSAGRIKWRGQYLTKASTDIAYLAQRSEVDWNFPLTVRGLVEMGRYPHVGWWKKFSKTDSETVSTAIDRMHLSDLADRQISALSGGQQQRAFVARALAQEAEVFLLDEPFTGLDRPSQELLTELLRDLTTSGKLVIASHHDLDTAVDIFDDILLVKQSKVAFGPAEETLTDDNLKTCFGGMSSPVKAQNFVEDRSTSTIEGRVVLSA